MTRDTDISRIYDDCEADEAFALFSLEGYDNADIEQVLGAGVANEYSSWIQNNLK